MVCRLDTDSMDVKAAGSAPVSKKVAQGNVTRDALVAAAREEFGAGGYSATSVDDIVLRADVTKGAFYHHFAGKKELFLRVFENVKRELSRAAFVTHVEHEPFAPPREGPRRLHPSVDQTDAELWNQLVERCRRFIELHTDPHLQRIVLVDARWVLTWEERQRVERKHGVVLLRADLRRAMRRGLVDRLPLRALALLLTGALDEACMLVGNAAERDKALSDAMAVIERFLEGLRADTEDGGAVR